jgi:deazaflavin-dependent oxidoreductase (nitroreductase family)
MSSNGAEKSFNEQIIDEFRANGGKVGGPFEGAPMVLLTTTGAKSGRERTTPLVYTSDGDRVVIIASAAGADKHPAWFHNLVAHPDVTLEVGTEQYPAQARVVEEPERSRLYAQMAAMMPGFNAYQEKTSRTIPVIILERAA